MVSGIYKITNNLNNHFYIGQSINISKRWKEHKRSFLYGKTHSTVLQKAFIKYGIENFKFEVLEECPVENLDDREVFYIATLKPKYNMNFGGSGNAGHVVAEETREILRRKGREQWDSYDTERKNQIIKNQLKGPKVGSHRSEETKKLLSEKTRDYFRRNNGMSQEQKEKISESLKGKKRPNLKKYKPVVGTSITGTKFYFTSIKYAALVMDINYSEICHCLRGNRKQAGGITWEYCSQETIHLWSRGELITPRSAARPVNQDEDIVHAIAKNRSYGVYDKGLITLARRSNTIKTIACEPVYSNDIFTVQLGCDRRIDHRLDLSKDRGTIIGYYCLVELTNGGIQFAVKSVKDIEKHRDNFSKSYKKEDSDNVWNKNFDAMALKTCAIQALKLCPISIEALEAVRREELGDRKEPEIKAQKIFTPEETAEDAEFTIQEEPKQEPKKPGKKIKTEVTAETPVEQSVENGGMSQEELDLVDQAFDNSFNGNEESPY